VFSSDLYLVEMDDLRTQNPANYFL
jgi:hypothetical protein